MTEEHEELELDVEALEDIELDPQLVSLLPLAFHNAPTEPLLPIILRLHQLWKDDEAHRILAFFHANPLLLGAAKSYMGLDVLDWGEAMYENAVEVDSFNKLAVLALSDYSPAPKSIALGFEKAVEDGRFGMALAILAMQGDQFVLEVGSDWVEHYKTLAAHRTGVPYVCAQVLNGTKFRYEPVDWAADLLGLADTLPADVSLENRIGYLTQQAEVFAANPTRHAINYMANQ